MVAQSMLLVAVLVLVVLISTVYSDCCYAIKSQQQSTPQSLKLEAWGRATSFASTRKYDIIAVFPLNYSIVSTESLFPMSTPNCVQSVTGPLNNPNAFKCAFQSTNPIYPSTFAILWNVIIPPPALGKQPVVPFFESFGINGEPTCALKLSVDECPDPFTGKPTLNQNLPGSVSMNSSRHSSRTWNDFPMPLFCICLAFFSANSFALWM